MKSKYATLIIVAMMALILGGGAVMAFWEGESAQPLSRSEMERAFGGANCLKTKAFPRACTVVGEGGAQSCWTSSITCTKETQSGTDYCMKVALTGISICGDTSAMTQCMEVTNGQCGAMYVGMVSMDGTCSTANCMVSPTPCGAQLKNTIVSNCP